MPDILNDLQRLINSGWRIYGSPLQWSAMRECVHLTYDANCALNSRQTATSLLVLIAACDAYDACEAAAKAGAK